MTIVDDRVLEYLSEKVEAGTPSEIKDGAGIPWSGGHVARRCRELSDKGFLVRISGAAVYRISDRGEQYLAGQYDARVHDNQHAETSGEAASAE